MAGRIRSIKPEVLEDELAANLGDAAWRLWVSLWVLADDHGNVRLGDRYLAANVWQDTTRDAATPRAELVAAGFVVPYAVNGQRYGHISGWEKHQRVDNAGKARVPGPEEDDGSLDNDSERLAGVSRRTSANVRALPLARRARAQSGGETSDHRPPTTDQDAAGAAAEGAGAAEVAGARRPARQARASRLPEAWKPSDETVAWCQGQGVDADGVLPEFVDYWRGVAGQRGTKLDWEATFRNRVRDMIRTGRAPAFVPPLPIHRAPGRERHMPKTDEEACALLGPGAGIAT